MEKRSTFSYALITGVSAGIGKEIAIECAKRNYNLYLISLPDTGLEDFGSKIEENYKVHVYTLCIDLTLKKAPLKVYHYALKHNIDVQILVNNAGVGFDGKLESLSVNLIDKMILLNVRASTLLTFLFLPGMKKIEKAYILNISSFGALTPVPYKCIYAATKSYLMYMTNAINFELKGTNINVLSVHPSGVSSERALENIRQLSFFARISTLKPEEVAKISIKNLLAGKKFIVPGRVTKFYYFLGLFLPYFIVLPLVAQVFRKTN
jgi:short-subunit dehydrogenase